MALPTYDATKHHIGLGTVGGTSYGLILAGSYRKALRRAEQIPEAFGGRPPTPDDTVVPVPPPSPPQPPPPVPPVPALGGPQPQVNDILDGEPGVYRWTQDDFSGGAFSFNWRQDAAAYSYSINLCPRPFDKTVRTQPPLVSVGGRNLNAEAPILVFAVDDEVCAVFAQANGLLRYHVNGGGVAWHPIPGTPTAAAPGITAAAFDPAEKVLYIGHSGRGVGSNGSGPIWRFDVSGLVSLSTGTAVPLKTNQLFLSPLAVANAFPVGISISGGAMIVAFATVNATTLQPSKGISLWLATLPDDTQDASKQPTWTRVGDLGGPWRSSALFNGFVYVLTANSSGGTRIVAVDLASASILPIAEFPYNFAGTSLKVHGGRLYVGGSATDVGGNLRFSELHEITGNSMRLVRSFGEEYRNSAAGTRPDAIRALESYEGMLYFGVGTSQLVGYDSQNDAFFGSSALINSGTVGGMCAAREGLYCWLTTPSGTNDGFYRIGLSGDSGLTSWSGYCNTADFAPYLDELKDWQEVRIFTRYGGCTLNVSTDGGNSWGSAITPTSTVNDGNDILTTFPLTAVTDNRRIRLSIGLPRTSGTAFTELVSFTLTYARPNPPQPLNNVAPSISGMPEKGQTLWVDLGKWYCLPTSYRVQWRRCDSGGNNCANVGGNTMGYELTQADVGHTIRAIVTASNNGGSVSATSAQTAVVTASTQPPNPPQAEFTASAVWGRSPLTVAFTDLTDFGRATSWAWTFGDGGTSTVQHPFHTYTAAGTYTVTLIATNASGNDTKIKTNYVHVEAALPDKHAWSFVVNGSEVVENLLRDPETYNLETLRDTLWSWADANTDLTLKDEDGTSWPVEIVSVEQNNLVVLPEVNTNAFDAREAFYQVTLVERV